MIDALPGDIFHRGQILNNTYEIEGVIGRGGTGEVYRARNMISGRVVAIKALNAQFSGQEGYIELMRREEQMRDIRDDAVVRYTECSRSDQGHVFLVMDYIAGPSIADEMLRRRLEPRELMIIGHRVSEGLVAAHSQGIVHRDLSPDNIILRDGHPEKATIIDFGIAKDTGAGARTIVGNDFAGKYEYAAPEQMEGKAEARSDLYALGALLLAAWKGQVPFAGMTPGEMIRRKQEKLDTAGVPEPLKGLIDWLTVPQLAQRAPSAQAVVDQVGKVLKGPAAERSTRPGPATKAPTRSNMRAMGGEAPVKRGRGGLVGLLLVGLLAVGGGGAWYLGMLDGAQERVSALFQEPLPVASPYVMTASAGGGLAIPRLKGHAPDEISAQAIRDGFAALAGKPAEPGAVTLADGMPTLDWAKGSAAAFVAADGLEGWRIEITDKAAGVGGIAASSEDAKRIRAGLEAWAKTFGFTLKTDIIAGPKVLEQATLEAALEPLQSCGALQLLDPPAKGYPLGATITVIGDAAETGLNEAISQRLEPLIGDRKLQVSINLLNPQLCRVRKEMPDLPNNAISIVMSQAATGEVNLTGVYKAGDNPVVDVLIPANVTKGQIWAMAVDNEGRVYHLLPTQDFADNEVGNLGVVEGGTRKIRLIYSPAEKRLDPRRVTLVVNPTDFGKSEFIAFLSTEAMFDTRRPSVESVESFAEALTAAQAERPGNIIGFATRILESRP